MARQDYFTSTPFLKAGDVKDGAKVTIERFDALKTRLDASRDGKPSPVLRLVGVDMPMGLNVTNYDILTTAFGEDETKWKGKKIRLRHIMVNNPQTNKLQKGLRIETL